MGNKNVETEIKLVTFSNEILDSLLELDLVRDKIVSPIKRRSLESHYYDTSKRLLAKAGVVYRVRKEPEGYVATVKLEKNNSGGLSDRTEYNVVVDSLYPNIDSMKRYLDLTDIVLKDNFEELFSVLVMRKQCDLQLTKDTKVEMAIDLGSINAVDKNMPIAELELELVTGNKKDLLEFVAMLSREVPLYPEHRSKFYRGILLLGEKLKQDKKEKKKEVNKNIKEVVFETMLQQLGNVLYGFTTFVFLNKERKSSGLNLICIELENLIAKLNFFEFIFEKEDFDKYHSSLFVLLNNLSKAYYIFSQMNFDKNDIFEFGYEKVEKDFSKAILNGEYTSTLFFVWSWLEVQRESSMVNIDDALVKSRATQFLVRLNVLINKEINSNLLEVINLVDALVAGLDAVSLCDDTLSDLRKLLIKLQTNLRTKKQQIQASKMSFELLYDLSNITGVELSPDIEILSDDKFVIQEKLDLFLKECESFLKK